MKTNAHLNILDYTIRSIFRHPITHISVIVIFSVVIFIAASLLFVIRSLLFEAENIISFSSEITVQKLIGGRQVPISIDIADEIGKIPGVRAVRPRVWGYLYDNVSGANYTIWGIRDDDIDRLKTMGLSFEEGGFWQGGDRGRIVVGAKLPGSIGLGGVRSLTLTGPSGESESFTIVGLFGVPSSLMTADLILMDEADARDFFGFTDDIATDIMVEVANPVEIAMIAGKIFALFPSCRVVSRAQLMRTYEAVFGYRGGFVIFAWFGCLVAFLFLLWNKGSVMTPSERKELGILKAVGWSTTDVMEVKILEAAIIGLISFAIGFITAYLHVYFFGAMLFKPVLFGWSVLYPDFRLRPVWEVGPIALLFIMTILPYLAASILPAWRSASIDPDDLLRGDKE